jgi:SAM-dependent methyltransferase
MIFASWFPLDIRTALVASLLAIAAGSSPKVTDAVEMDETLAQRRFREVAPWLPSELLSAGKLIAFEEHAHFLYLAGGFSANQEPSGRDDLPESCIRLVFLRPATLVVDVWPFDSRRLEIGKPTAVRTEEIHSASGKKSKRAVCIYHSPAEAEAPRKKSICLKDGTCNVAVTENDRTFRLELPLGLDETARITLESTGGSPILPKRNLPAGVMPHGPEGMQLIERWDSRYRGDSRPAWDKGFPSTHLKAAVEGGAVKPCRAVVLGCGTGTNAIYLAKQGFDVTAIDIAPTALNLANKKAEKEGVKVRWLLADVLAPPMGLEAFEFIFDRGCYHGVRRNNADGYVKTLKCLSRSGTITLILAGNANEERHYGPPRVKEEELRRDFSSAFDFVRLDTVRFDSVDPTQQGALAWLVLLCRKAEMAP